MNWIGIVRDMLSKGNNGGGVSAPTTPIQSINP